MESMPYLTAWVLYLLSAVGLTIVFWKLTARIKLRRTRRTLRTLVAVILYTPINLVDDGLWLAPAYLVGAYGWVLDHTEKAMQAGLYMSAAFCLVVVMIFLESVLRRLFDMGPRP